MKNTGTTGLFIALGALTAGLLLALYAPDPCKKCDCCRGACNRKKATRQHASAANDQPAMKIRRHSEDMGEPSSVWSPKQDAEDSTTNAVPAAHPDLVRWGTTQGVMDVADDKAAKQKIKKQLAGMAAESTLLTEALQGTIPVAGRALTSSPEQFRKWLSARFRCAQVTISNESDTTRTVRLWGGHEGTGVSAPLDTDVEDHELLEEITVATASVRQPQGVAVSPANGLTYVANQLTNNVTVLDNSGHVVTVIPLVADPEAGFTSPVAVAVNERRDSPNYGHVYVVGSVSNTVNVIDSSHAVVRVVSVGVRPMAIAYNPVNDRLYVPNLFHNTVSVLDATSETVIDTLSVGNNPIGAGVNRGNGDVFVTNSGDNTVTVIDRTNAVVTTITDVGERPVSAASHPVNEAMYVVAANSNEVYRIASDYSIERTIATGRSPYGIAYNPHNGYLYIGNRADNTFTILDNADSVRATIAHGAVNIGFAIDPRQSRLWVSDTVGAQVNLIGYSRQSSSVVASPGYTEDVREFARRPVRVQHSRWVFSDASRFLQLLVTTLNANGSRDRLAISHENYRSPSNYANVSEIDALAGTVIDGDTSWECVIAARQRITILVYYQRYSMKKVLRHHQTSLHP